MKHPFLFFFACLTLFSLGITEPVAAEEATFVVRPGSPIASIRQAMEKVRNLKKENKPIIVEFQSGLYPLADPIVFRPEDSGSETAPITYRAGKDQDVVFDGGRRITGWKKGENGVWSTHLAEVAEGKWYFEQLYVNGHRARRCRTPNVDAEQPYFYTVDSVDLLVHPETGRLEFLPNRAFVAAPRDLAPLEGLSPEQLKDVMFGIYHSWENSAHRVLSWDPDTGTVIFTGDARWKMMNWEPRQRYHVENLKSALDQPGEWFLDRDGTLSYIPLPGENPETMEIVAPVARAFLCFEGETDKTKPENRISHLSFEGLKFRYSKFDLPDAGHSDSQAAISMPYAVLLDGCRNISFENCEFAHIGGSAIRFHRDCRDCRFVKNLVYDLGGGGVYVGRAWEPNLDGIESSDGNRIENCIIRDGGRFDHGAIGVWIGHGSHNKVLHNDISEFYYTGVSVGWQWGYQPSRSHHNTIEFNRIHHLGHWVMSDMGGVYTLGDSPGTTVSNNVIHDVYAYSYGGWGLYTDEGSTGIVLENNLVYRVKTGTFHQHYGKENVVRNNILAYSLTDQIQRSRIEDHISFFLENNIILWDRGVLFGHPWSKDTLSRWGDDKVVIRKNLYWNPEADMSKVFPDKEGKGSDLQTWQKATMHDEGSLVADPGFKDPKNGDFTLPDDSPAFRVGFKRFNPSQAGVYGDQDWIETAGNYDHPIRSGIPPKPEPIPLRINDGFETPRSGPLRKASLNHEGRKALIRIVSDRPASGEKCLEIGDSSELKFSYNPHFYFSPDYRSGTVRGAFSLRVQKNAEPHVEWRNNANPYRIGPSLRVRDGKLLVGHLPPLDFPPDRWVRFEITATLGESSAGTWDLTLTFDDGTRREFKAIKNVHDDWKSLQWAGFCNLGQSDDDSSFFLDDLLLELIPETDR